MSFLYFLEGFFQDLLNRSSLSPLALKGIGVALLLFFLLFAVRRPGKFLKLLVLISIFLALGSVAYDVIQLGVERNKEVERHQPDFSTE